MKKVLGILLASTTLVFAPATLAAHKGSIPRTIHHPLSVGAFEVSCCGTSTAAAQFADQPYKGLGVQLQVTQPAACESAFAQTSINSVNGIQVHKRIQCEMTGLNQQPGAVANFSFNVSWTDPHGNAHSGVFTVANGGLTTTLDQTKFYLLTGAGTNQIAPGSTLNSVTFQLLGNNVASTQTAFVQLVQIDHYKPVYDLNTASQFCGNN